MEYPDASGMVTEAIPDTGTMTIEPYDDYNGIIRIRISDDSRYATIHVMLVGPVVHSGLNPAITTYRGNRNGF